VIALIIAMSVAYHINTIIMKTNVIIVLQIVFIVIKTNVINVKKVLLSTIIPALNVELNVNIALMNGIAYHVMKIIWRYKEHVKPVKK
jgi:hypothetical protein